MNKQREELFYEFMRLKDMVQLLSGIVQNDVPVYKEELKEWHDTLADSTGDLLSLATKVDTYLRENGKVIRDEI